LTPEYQEFYIFSIDFYLNLYLKLMQLVFIHKLMVFKKMVIPAKAGIQFY